MSLHSLGYFGWLPLCAAVCLRLPARWQTRWLALCSLVFYMLNTGIDLTAEGIFRTGLSWAAPAFVFWLLWVLGRRTAAAPEGDKKRLVGIGVTALLALLALFKYYRLTPLPTLLDGTALAALPFPLGLSFFTFAAIGYLVDVGRGDCEPAKRPSELFVFLFFFATVTSGPICRAGQLLPQLETEHRFDENRTVRALQLFALGLWKKVAIADLLARLCDTVFADIGAYGGPMLLLATALYTLQLYFDFCGYSEMARASGLLLGIELPENFKTPFFATNFSGFWTRWHISLSSWLQDYLFTPLAWADTSRLPWTDGHFSPLFCVFTVFFLSGFWHGNTLPFVVWGLLQALYRVGEELLHRHLGKPRRKAPAYRQWAKRAAVFVLWMFSMVFFRIGSGPDTAGLGDARAVIAGWLRGWGAARFAGELTGAVSAGFYADGRMIAAYLVFVVFSVALAARLDWLRFSRLRSAPAEAVLASRPAAMRWALYYILICSILAGLIAGNGGFGGGASFAYANF